MCMVPPFTVSAQAISMIVEITAQMERCTLNLEQLDSLKLRRVKILSRLNPLFQHLPVESMVHDRQKEYYRAINESSAMNDSGPFIDFMLRTISETLSGGVNGGVNALYEFIFIHPGCRANQIAEALRESLRTVQRRLAELKRLGMIEFRGAPRNGGYFRKSWRWK